MKYTNISIHWNGNVIILMKLSSLAASEVLLELQLPGSVWNSVKKVLGHHALNLLETAWNCFQGIQQQKLHHNDDNSVSVIDVGFALPQGPHDLSL